MSTSKVAKYGVDLYKIILNDSGVFDIDFVGANGSVNINGNLNVTGETTTIQSTELEIADNTITVNSGETGPGVTLGTAGIIVDRGVLSNANFLYDESLTTYINGVIQSNDGAFVLRKADETLSGLYVSGINSGEGNNLNLLAGQTVGVLTVTGTLDYELQVQAGDDDVIPNKAYVDNNISQAVSEFNLAIDADSGGPLNLVVSTDTLRLISGEGIDTSIVKVNNFVTLTISGEDASNNNKGIASFAAANFTVVLGQVSISNIIGGTY